MLETGFTRIDLDYPAEHLDPDGVAFPIPSPFAVRWQGRLMSFYAPAYSVLAAPFLAGFGEIGLRLPAALAAAACSVLFALWLQPVVGPRRAALGALVLTLATPLFFYGVTVWEHSLTVALCLGAVVVLRRLSTRRLVTAGFLAGSACWLREDLSLMVVGLAIACYFERRKLGDVLRFSLGVLPAALLVLGFNLLAFDHPLGLHVAAAFGDSEWSIQLRLPTTLAGALGFLWLCLGQLGALGASAIEATVLALGVLVIVALGCIAIWKPARATLPCCLALAAGLAMWLYGSSRIWLGPSPMLQLVHYNGLLVHMPLVALAIVGVPIVWRSPAYRPLRIGVSSGLVFLALQLAFGALTGPFTGGEWGPRELLPAFPAIVALLLAVLRTAATEESTASEAQTAQTERTPIWIGGGLAIAAGLASTLLSVWLMDEQKTEAQRLQEMILEAPTRVTVTSKPVLAPHLSALFRDHPIMLVRDPADFRRVTTDLQSASISSFLLVAPAGAGIPPGCQPWGRLRGQRVRYSDADLSVCDSSRAKWKMETAR